ncbi:SAM-dependent methyltransferase, partial [Erwinia amylovora]|nr:SAM-dependent methyltransferase [Erwinia amylovora]
PGFGVPPVDDDFSSPPVAGQHTVVKGGRWRSPGNEAWTSARCAFRRHVFQHSGLLCVVSPEQGSLVASPGAPDGGV